MKRLRRTPILLLKDFFEYDIGNNFPREYDNSSFREVLPELPVIEIIFALEILLILYEFSVKNFNEFLILIFFLIFLLLFLFTITNDAPF